MSDMPKCRLVESKIVNVAVVRQNPVAVRGLARDSASYMGLVESVKKMGLLNPISVLEKKDELGQTIYELVDGLHRFNAVKDAGLEEIPVSVMEFETPTDVLCAQIIANVAKIETKPSQYSDAIRRLLILNPMWTMKDLAVSLARSVQWCEDRLSLNSIKNDAIKKSIDDGHIPLTSAYALAKLPEDEQETYLADALSLPPDQFVPIINTRAKEISAQKRQGKAAPGTKEFIPVAHIRKMVELQGELESQAYANHIIDDLKVKKPLEVAKYIMEWVLNLDEDSVAAQKAKYEERKKIEEEARAKKKADKEEAKNLATKNTLADALE